MKKGTGKIREARKLIAAAHLAPLDTKQRYPIRVAAQYLKQSIPKTYQQIKSGALETFKQGRRRYATGRSIAALSLPPNERTVAGVLDAEHDAHIASDRTTAEIA
jgi:hypothetical protein